MNNTINTFWIQLLTYVAAAVAAILGGILGHTITQNFADMPQQLSAAFTVIAAMGPGYLLHHYLDGLLGAHISDINALQSTAAISSVVPLAPLTGELLQKPANSGSTPDPSVLNGTSTGSGSQSS